LSKGESIFSHTLRAKKINTQAWPWQSKASRLIANLAQTEAPAKLLIEKGVITEAEFPATIAEERATSGESFWHFV
jgi:hypothetical protein